MHFRISSLHGSIFQILGDKILYMTKVQRSTTKTMYWAYNVNLLSEFGCSDFMASCKPSKEDRILKSIWKVFEKYLKIIWKLFENYLKSIWKLFENYLKSIWKLFEKWQHPFRSFGIEQSRERSLTQFEEWKLAAGEIINCSVCRFPLDPNWIFSGSGGATLGEKEKTALQSEWNYVEDLD